VSSNFNISTQETAQFYDGFLKPVDLTILDYFIRQGYSRELLFWMFMDSFQVGKLGFQYNPPYDFGCPVEDPKRRCFREYIELATISGLSVETRTVDSGGGGGGNSDKGNAGGGKGGGGGGGGGGGSKGTKVYSRFCFDGVLAQRAQAAMKQVNPERWSELQAYRDNVRPSPICGESWTPESTSVGATDTLTFKVGPYPFAIQPRSAYSMFQFLGNLIKLQRTQGVEAEGVYVPRDDEREVPKLSTVADDRSLFTVTQEITGECFAHTWFNDGDYCIPDNAANTKRIFSMLAQLIAIQTQASDLSITPTVRVIQ
jgi:hypothetical protein